MTTPTDIQDRVLLYLCNERDYRLEQVSELGPREHKLRWTIKGRIAQLENLITWARVRADWGPPVQDAAELAHNELDSYPVGRLNPQGLPLPLWFRIRALAALPSSAGVIDDHEPPSPSWARAQRERRDKPRHTVNGVKGSPLRLVPADPLQRAVEDIYAAGGSVLGPDVEQCPHGNEVGCCPECM